MKLSKQHTFLIISLMTTFLCLIPTIYNGWVNWDDPTYILTNPLVKDFSFEGITKMFTTTHVLGAYTPIVLLSWSLDYVISGLNPMTFHITNMILHLIIVALIFNLVKLITKRIEVAFIVSILFGIHPMHVESVAWITARKDLLYTLFFIVALIIYHYYTEKQVKYPRWYYYIACFVVYLLSLLSKGTAVIFPLILFALDFLKGRENLSKIILEKIPFFILSIIFTYIAISSQALTGAMDKGKYFSLIDSIFVGFYGYFIYLIKVFIPFNLSAYHPYPTELGEPIPNYFYITAIPVFIIFLYIISKLKKHRELAFGMSFFFISLIPVIQVLSFGSAITADRFTYLPYFGLFYIIGIGFIWLFDNYKNYKRVILFGGILYLLILSGITYKYSRTWKSSETMWSNTINHYPEDFLAYMNRSTYRQAIKQYDNAMQDCEKSISINPKYHQLYYNRGVLHNLLGNKSLALKDYNKALKIKPFSYETYLNRGILYTEIEDYDKALFDFNKSVEINPEDYLAYYNRAILYKNTMKYENAINDFSKVISSHQLLPEAFYMRGDIYMNLRQLDKATSDFNNAIKYAPKYANAYTKRGTLFFEDNNIEMAMKDFDRAIQLDSSQVDAYINRGIISMNMQQFNKAFSNFNTAQNIDPKNYLIYLNRGLAYVMLEDYDSALIEINKSIELNPDYTFAKNEKEKIVQLLKKNSQD